MTCSRFSRVVWSLLFCTVSVSVFAQENPDVGVENDHDSLGTEFASGNAEVEPELTTEEQLELEAALAADQKSPQKTEDTEPVEESGRPLPVAVSLGDRQASFLDIAVILDAAGAYFTDEPLQLGAHDPNQTGFTLQQLEFSLGANVDPYFRFDANLVFSLFGVEVEEAYGTTLDLPASLQVRAGQFLTRFGRINATHPHAWAFLDQPLANGKFFGGEGSRGLGAEVSWLTPLPWYVETLASVTTASDACCARSFFGGNAQPVSGPEDLLYTTAIKQLFAFSQNTSLSWGLSAQFGPNASGFGNRTEIYGTDLYLRFRPTRSTRRMSFSWTAEAMFRSRQIPHGVLQDFGGYTQAVWSISPRWETGARYEFVSGLDDDPLDPEWLTHRQRGAAQLTFYPSHFSRIRFQTMLDDIPGRERILGGFMLNIELVAGAHGSHSF